MPSPPPRKVKPTVWLKEIHAKQLGSLQGREQQLVDIIEDIRSYSKQRGDIEKLYGQSLLKLSSQFLSKKELFQIDEKNPSEENRTLQSTWRHCLEETEKCGTVRVKAADVYSQNVSDRVRALKLHKATAVKRALDQLNSLQNDLSLSVKEFGAAHKQYTDDEIVAYEARNKATDADKRLNNKDTGLFSSVSTLKKSQAKSFVKMEQCNSQSTASRNGYLLELSAVNAHTSRIHNKHIPILFKALDDGVYDQLSSCISIIAQTEIDSCTNILSTHSGVVSSCEKVTPQYNLDCFLQSNPVFAEQLTFQFEPVQNDSVDYLSIEYGEEQRLEKETRNWARKVAKETKSLADLHDRINQVTNKTASTQGTPSDAAMEAELLRLQGCVRRSEIAKLKAEARLELLRTANMPVDVLLSQATTEHESQTFPDTQSLTSRGSSHHSFDTFDSSGDNLERTSHSLGNHNESTDRISSMHLGVSSRNQFDNLSTSQDSALSTVIVIYDYRASQPDELTLTEGELLSILDHGSGDGWLKACNSDGTVGMVPENYITPYEDTTSLADNSGMSAGVDSTLVSPQSPQQSTQQSFPPSEQPQQLPPQPQYIPPPVAPPPPALQGIGYVRALFDYQGDGDDEISFSSGQVITLLSRDVNGIDDGYFKGEVDGVQGLFPSLVVEELDGEFLPPSGDLPTDQQFDTWSEPPQQASPPYQQQYEPPQQQVVYQQAAVQEAAAPQSFAGSYSPPSLTYNSNIDTAAGLTHSSSYSHYNPAAPLPAIPDEDEVAYERQSESELTMNATAELYPAHTSPRVRRAQTSDIPPAINRRTKPVGSSPVKPPAPQYSNNYPVSELESSRPTPPPKPTVDYSRKPMIEDPPPHPTGPTDNDSYEKPMGRKFQRSNVQGDIVEPLPRNNQNQSAIRPDTMNLNYAQSSHSDYPDHHNQHSQSLYEEIPHTDGNIRGRYHEVGGSRPLGSDLYSRNDDEEVERRKFRQMQPVPHQYYIDHAGGRYSGEPLRDRGASVRGSDPNLLKDRSSSNRSFTSFSSTDSQDEKNVAIRIPGRRHLSSDTPSEPSTPVAPMSLREASRLMPQGLVNPSYRVATMSEDMMSPASNAHRPTTARHGSRPTPSRRQGGLPGHVRQGIVQGRKMLSDAANDSVHAGNDPQATKRQPSKSETAV